jgi:hypothetical protein
MKKNKELCRSLIGRWVSCDDWKSSVEHRISISKGEYKVSVTDLYDGEKGEVYDVKWDGTRLNYCVHWPSTGRFAKNSVALLEKGRLDLCYTYSEQDTLVKRPLAKQKRKKKT